MEIIEEEKQILTEIQASKEETEEILTEPKVLEDRMSPGRETGEEIFPVLEDPKKGEEISTEERKEDAEEIKERPSETKESLETILGEHHQSEEETEEMEEETESILQDSNWLDLLELDLNNLEGMDERQGGNQEEGGLGRQREEEEVRVWRDLWATEVDERKRREEMRRGRRDREGKWKEEDWSEGRRENEVDIARIWREIFGIDMDELSRREEHMREEMRGWREREDALVKKFIREQRRERNRMKNRRKMNYRDEV